ncbi:MAG: hypothetical protein ACRD3Q_17385 [Terriglobales bacterium]
MKAALAFSLLLLPAAALGAQAWRSIATQDAMTDKVTTSAFVVSDDGFKFAIYRGADGEAWAHFELAPRVNDGIDPRALLEYRIDQYGAETLEALRLANGAGLPLLNVEPRWVDFRIAGSLKSKFGPLDLRRLQAGQRLIVRYFLFTGGSRDVYFSLDGARETIAQATGLSATWDEQGLNRELEKAADAASAFKTSQNARSAAFRRCDFAQYCVKSLGDCVRQYPEAHANAGQARLLTVCLDKVGR